MEVIPAIDLRDGRCVRLVQGDFAQETVFSDDPVGVACQWEAQGAPRLHVVDLDGAATGVLVNLTIVEEIARRVRIPLQLGGGIRTVEQARRVFQGGVDRVVLGTVAAEHPPLVEELISAFGPQAVVVGVDARDGMIAIRGWREQSSVGALELAREMVRRGAVRVLYTDIGRDGTLAGPNLPAIAQMVEQSGVCVLASGGIASLEHVKLLAELGVEGAVVGRALYTGAIRLPEAIAALG